MEGDQVEVCVIFSGNSEIDIPVEIIPHDITVNGILLFALLTYLLYNFFSLQEVMITHWF